MRPADLRGLPEIGFGISHDFGRSVERVFAMDGVERHLSIEVGATTAAVAMVRAGGGIAIVDALVLEYLPSGVVARPLRPEIHRPVLLVRTESSGTPALTGSFQALLERFCRELQLHNQR